MARPQEACPRAIEGDDDLDGVVTVRFRAAGEGPWRDAMPLRRVPAGESRRTNPIFRWASVSIKVLG